MLVLPAKGRKKKDHFLILEDDLFDFLEKRKGKLEAVVITGGEPTLHKDLPEFLGKIKKLGYKIKLDTNGTNPAMLLPLLAKERGGVRSGGEPLIDYIAMDIKAPLGKYTEAVGLAKVHPVQSSRKASGGIPRDAELLHRVNLSKIRKSIKLIIDSGLPYEFRTTIVPGLILKEDIAEMGKLIKGAKIWYLQQFKPDTDLVDKKFKKVRPYKDEELEEMRKIGEKYVGECRVR
jgi:pyruvate formate lyase activating enzyme